MAEVIAAEDPNLAAHVRAGDRTAIQTVVETYLAQILRAARGAGLDPQQAEDVTQATFTTFIEAASRFDIIPGPELIHLVYSTKHGKPCLPKIYAVVEISPLFRPFRGLPTRREPIPRAALRG